MGPIFLILFAGMEIALMVLTCTKWREKSKFLRNRALVTATEFLFLLLLVLLPTTYMKWRFVGAIVFTFLRFAFAAVNFLVKRKRAEELLKIPARIVCCILVVNILASSLIPAFVFSNYNGLVTSGEYEVNECSAILVDSERIDDFENDGSHREVPVHFYYPDAEGKFPLVIFSHGAFGYYQSNYSTYAELVSNGYVVAALDHPHHAFFSKDTSGKTVIVDMEFITNAVDFSNLNMENTKAFEVSQQWMNLRVDDGNFVLDTIKNAKAPKSLDDSWYTETEEEILKILSITDTEKIGYMGHSMGGATAVALGRERNDIDAVIDLDGSMITEIKSFENGEFQFEDKPYPVPLLDFRKESDYNDMEQLISDGTYKGNYAYGFTYVNDNTVEKAENAKSVVFKNAGHMNFTDLPMFSPFLGSMLGTGEVDSEEFMYTVNGIVLNWFDYYLKGEGSLNIKATY